VLVNQFTLTRIYERAELTAQVPIIKPAQRDTKHKNSTNTQKQNAKQTNQKSQEESNIKDVQLNSVITTSVCANTSFIML
jgi:hypothetical protein